MARVTYLRINACKYKYKRVEKLTFPCFEFGTVKSRNVKLPFFFQVD